MKSSTDWAAEGYEKPPLTVGELRKLLEPLDPDLEIYSEGCDCTEVAGFIEVSDYVEIRRLSSYRIPAPPKPPEPPSRFAHL